ESTEIYHARDFKLHIDSQDSPRQNYHTRPKPQSSPRANLSQSERDWAFAKRALARGEAPEDVMRQIAEHRVANKYDPEDYAKRTVTKAQAELHRGTATAATNDSQPIEDQQLKNQRELP